MKLEVGTFPVRDVRFGPRTGWRDGVLGVNREELLGVVKEDRRLTEVEIDIARPGDQVRIINRTDVVEPKVKVTGNGVAYPGICGRPTTTVGSGRTHRLGNFAVVECLDRSRLNSIERHFETAGQNKEGSGWGRFHRFIDKSGPGAVTPYAGLHNIVLTMVGPTGIPGEDLSRCIRSATLRVADLLAETVRKLEPPELETFDLTPKPGLPGYVFVPYLTSGETRVGPRSSIGKAIYGQTRLSAPWALSGTEILDGAVAQGGETWAMANNPIVLNMLREHGKRCNFLGCLVQRTYWTAQEEKELVANRGAVLASMLGARGAIFTIDSRGARFPEVVLGVQACEQAGIKTVLLTQEEDNEGGGAPPLIVTAPEMVSVVSSGTGAADGPFPPVKKVLGSVYEVEAKWYEGLPPVPGRYGGGHFDDIYGFGKVGCVDF